VLQIGVGEVHIALIVQPAMQRCWFKLQVAPEPQSVEARHCTQSPDGAHSGAPTLHWSSVRQCTQSLAELQKLPLPQLASPMHSTQTPAAVSQYGLPGGHCPSPVQGGPTASLGGAACLLLEQVATSAQHAITATPTQRLIRSLIV
jgi:hypothetical protein